MVPPPPPTASSEYPWQQEGSSREERGILMPASSPLPPQTHMCPYLCETTSCFMFQSTYCMLTPSIIHIFTQAHLFNAYELIHYFINDTDIYTASVLMHIKHQGISVHVFFITLLLIHMIDTVFIIQKIQDIIWCCSCYFNFSLILQLGID